MVVILAVNIGIVGRLLNNKKSKKIERKKEKFSFSFLLKILIN